MLVDTEFHATGDPHALWRWMRLNAPVQWHPPGALPGFWSLTRYEDIRGVYRDPQTFSSARGVLLRPTKYGEDPGGGLTLALTDPPRHKQLRAIVAEWFTARSTRSLEQPMRGAAQAIVARAIEQGECDFVHDVAGRLSMHVIGHVIGVPADNLETLFQWTNEAFEAHTSLAAHRPLMLYFIDLMHQRMAQPTNDLMSMLANGVADGLVTEDEVLLNCENLVGATENGRLALAGAMLAFLEHPDQWRRLGEDRSLLPTAVEEILRWTSSATHSMRSATRPEVIHGQRIEAGDWVVLWIPSANRDEDVFTDPAQFRIGRSPNRHLAFGASEHFCLGSTVARAQMGILLSELLDTASQIEQSGPALAVRSIAVSGPARLPMRITAK
jgi:cytochrome P450